MTRPEISHSWLPPHFKYMEDRLYIENIRVEELANEFGTPCYVYSANSIRDAFERYKAAFSNAGIKMTICYAVKANSNLSILKLLAQMGAGADVVSAGELYRALQAGIDPAKIVFAGVGKTSAEIDFALDKNIHAFNIESLAELDLIEQRAQARNNLDKKISISIRCNPDVVADTHPYITTGTHSNKFGMNFEAALEVVRRVASSNSLKLKGLQVHIGSQLLTVEPIVEAFKRLVLFASKVEALSGLPLEYLDIGGGLGISYTGEQAEQPESLARGVANVLAEAGRNYPLLSEPGRYIVGEAGALITQVLYLKSNDNVNFMIVDAGMTDLIRPSLYQATHTIIPLTHSTGKETKSYEVVGPVCESGDWLGHNIELGSVQSGERLAILSAGAYGFAMSSNYNSRLRPAEILIDNIQAQLIRRRETFEDLIVAEQISPYLRTEA